MTGVQTCALPILDTPCQTTSKTGTQTHPLAERLPKIILSSQTPQNTPPDTLLPTRKIRSSLIHQNTANDQATAKLHRQTTSKIGTQPHPLAERWPKIIISSQTPQNIQSDVVLLTRKTRFSLIHQNTGTSPLHQEAYTTH